MGIISIMIFNILVVLYAVIKNFRVIKILLMISNNQIKTIIQSSKKFKKLLKTGVEEKYDETQSSINCDDKSDNHSIDSLFNNKVAIKENEVKKHFKGVKKNLSLILFRYLIIYLIYTLIIVYEDYHNQVWIDKLKKFRPLMTSIGKSYYSYLYSIGLS